MQDRLAGMTNYLHEYIPITAHLGVRVVAFDDSAIRLRAPLAANINHRDTAFGGSIASLGILAGWALLHFSLVELDMASRVVIQNSATDFLAPGDADFEAVATMPDAAAWERFLAMLRRKGRARIRLASELQAGDQRIAAHEGVYVAVRTPVS